MKKYRKLLTVILVIVLSIASTAISFFYKRSYGWMVDVPEKGVDYYNITQFGFPYGWYEEIIHPYTNGYIQTFFRLEVFIVDTIIYIVMYSSIAGFIYLINRHYVLKEG